MRDRPWYRLTRHFFDALFDFGFLSDAGVQSFTRLLLGIAAAFISFGLLLVRVYMYKYAALTASHTPEPYRQAVLSDYAFLIAIPMWIVAFVTVLVGHALFPDEADFRILMALPVSRRLVFGAKLLALALFAGLFVVPVQVALTPVFVLMSVGRWVEYPLALQLIAFEIIGVVAAAWAVLLIAALQGLVVLLSPQGRVFAISAALRSVMLCSLVLALPFLGRLPAEAKAISRGAPWLWVAPPIWFLGVERWSLGDTRAHLTNLAAIGVLAFLATAIVAVGSYVWLYRRFDRVMHRPVDRPAPRWLSALMWTRHRRVRRPVFTTIRHFATLTLRRSVLHQGIVVVLSALGAGLVVNSLLGQGVVTWLRSGASSPELLRSAIWSSFALVYVAVLAVRVSLSVPIDLRANWVFRMSEQGAARVDQLEAAAYTVGLFGVVTPAALMLPLQWGLLGPRALVVFAAAIVSGWLFAEILLKDWARIPFTCSYLPGKGFVPQMILKGLGSFVVFSTFGSALALANLSGRTAAIVMNAIVVGVAVALRTRRRRTWASVILEFEDELPNEASPLRLH